MRLVLQRVARASVASLLAAGGAIDSVHAAVPQWLRPGRTEREVGRDIADAILAAGHTTVDFVIVASGPNGASPHHEVSDRVIEPGDPVVVDIGGTMPDGYCSDETRMYSAGEPSREPGTAAGTSSQPPRRPCAASRPPWASRRRRTPRRTPRSPRARPAAPNEMRGRTACRQLTPPTRHRHAPGGGAPHRRRPSVTCAR